ncbi:MAG TPA: hypothetical protein VHH34_06765 [Pseudonocardiaceae bacterium]|nr:hypothetical protein [Pseudonocardiaceae bacterium]
MNEPIDLYITVVVFGAVITVLVGVLLYRNGEPFLTDVFGGDRERAIGINRLLVLLFHLIVLGLLALISVLEVPWAMSATQLVLTKLGVVLLVLGAAHGATMVVLTRIRLRRRMPRAGRGPTVQPAEQAPRYQAGASGYDPAPGQ